MRKETLKSFLRHPSKIIPAALVKFGKWLPDSIYLRCQFYAQMGHMLNLKHPKTFNEKLQWLKLNDRKPEYTTMVDKVEAKKWVEDRIGAQYIIPTLGVWERAEDIDFDSLPNQFVLKTNHDSGAVIICKDKSKLDIPAARKKLAKSLKFDYYKAGREWPYKNVKRRIFAEELIQTTLDDIPDYKIFCFDGQPKFLFVATERQKEGVDVKFDFFDTSFNHLPFKQRHENASITPAKPKNFEKMVDIAAELSKGYKHIRVDLYNIEGEILFGELTFYHFNGTVPFNPGEWDYKFGKLINLPSQT